MCCWADGGAIDEDLALHLPCQQAISACGEDVLHRLVIGDDGDDVVCCGRNIRQLLGCLGADLTGQRCCGLCVDVEDGCDGKSHILQVSGDVGAHSTEADDADRIVCFAHWWHDGSCA